MGLLDTLIRYSVIIFALVAITQLISTIQLSRLENDSRKYAKENREFGLPITGSNNTDCFGRISNFIITSFSSSSSSSDQISSFLTYLVQKFPKDLISFLNPPPLSPHFQKGGQFEGWNEDFVMTVGVMLLLGILDVTIVRNFITDDARYFALHAVANGIATVAAAPDVFRAFFVDPASSFSGASSTMMANSAIAAIHVYHCVAFKLSAADIFHHAVFVIVLCGLAIPFKQFGGVANNFGCFFLSGLPGGLDYLLHVAYRSFPKYTGLTKLKEKKYNSLINQWMRGPSMTWYTATAWINFINGKTSAIPTPFLFVVVALHFYNGSLYAREVFESYAVHKERARVAAAEDEGEKISSPVESKKKK